MKLSRSLSSVALMGMALGACWPLDTAEVRLAEPVQMNQEPWKVADGMTGLATISGKVLVLSTKQYPTAPADTLSAASPLDLAVAWGPAASSEVRKAVELTQSDRRYNWRARQSDMDIEGVRHFTRYSSNWHIIPATPQIAEQLRKVAKDDVVSIEGDLVQVTFGNGIFYRSSTSRDDTGDGACEIIFVRSVSTEGRAA